MWYGLWSRTANLKEKLPDQIVVVEARWSWFWEGKFLTYGGRNDSEKVIFIQVVENFYNLGCSNCRREARMKVELQLSIEPSQVASSFCSYRLVIRGLQLLYIHPLTQLFIHTYI